MPLFPLFCGGDMGGAGLGWVAVSVFKTDLINSFEDSVISHKIYPGFR